MAWVNGHTETLRNMVAEGERPDVFINKVRSAMNLPSSGVVADAIARLKPPLIIDKAALDELDKRNIPAHNFRMNKPYIDYDVDRDVERVDILRSLMVALVARASGYDGAIAGWVRGKAIGWKPQPGWWPAPPPATTDESRTEFFCEREPRRPVPSRVFRSRLTKSQSCSSQKRRRG